MANSGQKKALVTGASEGIGRSFAKKLAAEGYSVTAVARNESRLNCDALVALSHAFLVASRKGDALVNVASTLSFLPLPTAGLYAATKAFVTSFSESLWFEQKGRGVYVMNLCPGITATHFHHRAGGTETDKPPVSLTQTPEQVVEVAYKALLKRRVPTVISGVKNRAFAGLARVMPRKTTVNMMGGMG